MHDEKETMFISKKSQIIDSPIIKGITCDIFKINLQELSKEQKTNQPSALS